MGRPSSFREEDVFAALTRCLVEAGEVRMQTLTAFAGVSTGSLYHRFGSREGLMAAAWLDALTAFQARFLAALEAGEAGAPEDPPGLAAALATPVFCREEPDRARLLIVGRASEMMSDAAPAELRVGLAAANAKARAAIAAFADRKGLPVARVRLGLIGLPLGAVRLYLPAEDVPDSVDEDIRWALTGLFQEGR